MSERLQDYAPDLIDLQIVLTVTEAESLIESGFLTRKPMTFEDATIQTIIHQIKEQM